jgi:hypothetical protein
MLRRARAGRRRRPCLLKLQQQQVHPGLAQQTHALPAARPACSPRPHCTAAPHTAQRLVAAAAAAAAACRARGRPGLQLHPRRAPASSSSGDSGALVMAAVALAALRTRLFSRACTCTGTGPPHVSWPSCPPSSAALRNGLRSAAARHSLLRWAPLPRRRPRKLHDAADRCVRTHATGHCSRFLGAAVVERPARSRNHGGPASHTKSAMLQPFD